MKKKKNSILLTILKSPYTIAKGIYNITKRAEERGQERKIKKIRSEMKANYESFKEIKRISGDLTAWEDKIDRKEGLVGIILGARGTGKSAIGLKLLENTYYKSNKKCYAMGFKEESLPIWIESIDNTANIQNNSAVLIDEGGILFSSRKSMTNANKLLSELLFISRHKNLTVLFISQNSANLEINAIRQADFLVLKPTALLQKEFERKKIADIYTKVQPLFKKYKEIIGLTYIYSNEYTGFIANPLPSFWSSSLSKSFG